MSFATVSALTTALALRDPQTAEHSRRVADYCAMVAKNMLSPSEAYALEVAALLHDIGKLGIPDSVLHKPGRLTEKEWQIMAGHNRMRVAIIHAAGASDRLVNLLRYHNTPHARDAADGSLPASEDIPLGSRILAVAEAFDTMVSGSVYRSARTQEEAIEELLANAGSQFDAAVVEQFIQDLRSSDRTRAATCCAEDTAGDSWVDCDELAAASV